MATVAGAGGFRTAALCFTAIEKRRIGESKKRKWHSITATINRGFGDDSSLDRCRFN
jgi:hypothetical protein